MDSSDSACRPAPKDALTVSHLAHQPDRVHLRNGAPAHQGDQGTGLAGGQAGMAYKLIESAQSRWRALNAPHLVALVRAGATFEKGVMVERSDELNEEVAA